MYGNLFNLIWRRYIPSGTHAIVVLYYGVWVIVLLLHDLCGDTSFFCLCYMSLFCNVMVAALLSATQPLVLLTILTYVHASPELLILFGDN